MVGTHPRNRRFFLVSRSATPPQKSKQEYERRRLQPEPSRLQASSPSVVVTILQPPLLLVSEEDMDGITLPCLKNVMGHTKTHKHRIARFSMAAPSTMPTMNLNINDTSTPLFSFGIKFLIVFHIYSVIMWIFGQTYCLIDYELVASWGLQEPRDLVPPAIVQVNQGIAIADTIQLIPLHLMSIVGLLQRKFYGVICSWMVLSVGLYWPLIYVGFQIKFAQGDTPHTRTDLLTGIVVVANMVIAIWGSWFLCRSKELIPWWIHDFDDLTTTTEEEEERPQSSVASSQQAPLLQKEKQ